MKCRKCHSEWNSRASITKCPFCGESLVNEEELKTMPQILKHIVELYGTEVLLNTNRIVSLASDFGPELEKERRLLKVCGDAGIIKEMLSVTNSDAPTKEALISKSVMKLETNFMLSAEWAKMGISFISSALGWNVGIEEKVTDGEVTSHVLNGGKYTGTLKNGKPEGNGRFVFDDGHIYEGEFSEGRFWGKGKIFWNHGNRRKKEWGDTWTGEWKNGAPWEGSGTYVWGDYEKISTIPFSEGKQEGVGIITENSGLKFSGSMKNGKYHGVNCQLIRSDGSVLAGEFRENELFCGFEFDSDNNLINSFNDGVVTSV